MGVADIPLSAEGKKQAKSVSRLLKDYPIDVIVSSPLLRAVQTAKTIHEHHKEAQFLTLDALHERSFGVLEGLKYEEANARYPQIVMGYMWQYPNFRPPEGESLSDVAKRAQEALAHLVSKYGGKTIAVVSHGSFIRNFLSVLLGLPLEEVNKYEFVNASVSIVRHSPFQGAEVHVMNKIADSID